jgi:hypothetical protein
MEVQQLNNLEVYQFAFRMLRIANRAIRKTQEENRRQGVANVYEVNGVLYSEINGQLTLKNPNDKSRTIGTRNQF